MCEDAARGERKGKGGEKKGGGDFLFCKSFNHDGRKKERRISTSSYQSHIVTIRGRGGGKRDLRFEYSGTARHRSRKKGKKKKEREKKCCLLGKVFQLTRMPHQEDEEKGEGEKGKQLFQPLPHNYNGGMCPIRKKEEKKRFRPLTYLTTGPILATRKEGEGEG